MLGRCKLSLGPPWTSDRSGGLDASDKMDGSGRSCSHTLSQYCHRRARVTGNMRAVAFSACEYDLHAWRSLGAIYMYMSRCAPLLRTDKKIASHRIASQPEQDGKERGRASDHRQVR